MGYVDRQLDQVQQLLNQGNAQGAHQLARGIALDEPQNQRAQALLAEATRRLQAPPPLYTQPQPQYPPRPVYVPPPATKKNNTLGFILITLILGVGAWLFFSSASSGTRSPPGRSTFGGNPASSSLVSVTLRVTTEEKGSVSLTYQNATGGTEQRTVGTPWTQTFKVKPGTFVYVSAQASAAMTVTCKITANGTTIQEATSRGKYVIASCSGSAR